MLIRGFDEADWPQVWTIVHEVVGARETFPFESEMTEEAARGVWLETPPGLTVVAVDEHRIVGSAKMGPNRPGPGSHISTASFMVASEVRGRGIGTALCRYALDWARGQGYAGMQFNAVVDEPFSGWALPASRLRDRGYGAPRVRSFDAGPRRPPSDVLRVLISGRLTRPV